MSQMKYEVKKILSFSTIEVKPKSRDNISNNSRDINMLCHVTNERLKYFENIYFFC